MIGHSYVWSEIFGEKALSFRHGDLRARTRAIRLDPQHLYLPGHVRKCRCLKYFYVCILWEAMTVLKCVVKCSHYTDTQAGRHEDQLIHLTTTAALYKERLVHTHCTGGETEP